MITPKETQTKPPAAPLNQLETIASLLNEAVEEACKVLDTQQDRDRLHSKLDSAHRLLCPHQPQLCVEHAMKIIRTEEELAAAMEHLRPEPVVVVAFADSGPKQNQLVGLAIRTPAITYYFPLGHLLANNQLVPDQLHASLIARQLSLLAAQMITCNAKILLHFLSQYGAVMPSIAGDVMLADQLLNEKESVDLHRPLGSKLQEGANSLAKRGQGLRFESVCTIAALLAERCKRIAEVYEKQRVNNRNEFLLNDVELPLLNVLHSMEGSGYAIDLDFVNQQIALGKAQEKKRTKSKAKAKGSKAKSAHRGKTKAKADPANKASCQISSEMLKVCHWIKDNADTDGRLHGDYKQNGTKSGRITASGYTQTISKKDPSQPRRVFVATAGHQLVTADFCQQDLHVLACVSQEQQMLNALEQEVDLHSAAARDLFDLKCEISQVKEHYPAQREKAKQIQLAIINGAPDYLVAKQLEIPDAEAKKLISKYFKKYKKVKKFIEKAHGTLHRHHYVDDVFGRRRWFPELKDEPEAQVRLKAQRAAQNHLIQAASATIMKLAMIRCHRHIAAEHPEIRMVLTLHDELHFEVPKSLVDHFAKELPDLMGNLGLERFGFTVPLRVEVKTGPSWGNLTVYKGGSRAL